MRVWNKMINSIKRFFAHWHRISREKVPRWVKGKLYKQKYVRDRGREYKKIVTQGESQYTNGLHPDDSHYEVFTKKWKKQKFYYRKLKI